MQSDVIDNQIKIIKGELKNLRDERPSLSQEIRIVGNIENSLAQLMYHLTGDARKVAEEARVVFEKYRVETLMQIKALKAMGDDRAESDVESLTNLEKNLETNRKNLLKAAQAYVQNL